MDVAAHSSGPRISPQQELAHSAQSRPGLACHPAKRAHSWYGIAGMAPARGLSDVLPAPGKVQSGPNQLVRSPSLRSCELRRAPTLPEAKEGGRCPCVRLPVGMSAAPREDHAVGRRAVGRRRLGAAAHVISYTKQTRTVTPLRHPTITGRASMSSFRNGPPAHFGPGSSAPRV